MRIAMRALAVSRRSMVAIKRPNNVVEGVRPIETDLDILVPWLLAQRVAAFCSGANLCIPDASGNAFVCIAAY